MVGWSSTMPISLSMKRALLRRSSSNTLWVLLVWSVCSSSSYKVRTDPVIGLTKDAADKAIAILRENNCSSSSPDE